ncbi:LLM class flavin-dependent oxidoreductase [Solwaraspora sp. WMMB335]|uniref:LLM class flavin-dependent oxidoreductase n=1 Tax=Solwaraspora sp. WMMB335 TaxID=3404118 RepID=UPI003B93319F
MRFGVNFFPVVDPEIRSADAYFEDSLSLVELAEELGFTHVQTVEHHASSYGGFSPDPLLFLASAAARTSRIRVVTGAVVAPLAHPVAIAGRLAMLDNLSKGRLDVGFGRGFLPAEFALFDVPMQTSRARFAECVEACRRLWMEEDVVVKGEFHRFGPVTVTPRPLQRPHPPIYVAAATSPDSATAAGRNGFHLQVVPSVTTTEQLREILGAYRAAWVTGGRPAGAHDIQIKYSCYLHEDRRVALAWAEQQERNYISHMARAVAPLADTEHTDYPGYAAFPDKAAKYDFDASLHANKVLAGDPDDVRRQLAEIAASLGDDLSVSLQFNAGTTELAAAAASMRLFAAHVAAQPATVG